MDCCGLLTPGYVRLLESCYPGNKVLASTPLSDIKPASNELGRLSFLCTNGPASRLAKVTAHLQKKAAKQAKNAHKNPKSKAALCVSLEILKRLVEDCRQMLTAAAPHALAIFSAALTVPDTSGSAAGYSASGGSWDLSVVERVASTFASFAAFAQGSWLGLDPDVCTSYLSVLSTLANIAVQPYEKNEANASSLRMLGLYALSASFSADAFDSTEPERQIHIAMPALLANLSQRSASIPVLNQELSACEERATSSGFQKIKPSQRVPLEKRRARSFRLEHHGEAEKQKESHAVIGQSLVDLALLLQHGRAKQIEQVHAATVAWLDQNDAMWTNVEWCCWLAQAFTQLTQIQHRFVIVTGLLEALLATPPQKSPTPKQITLLNMITAVLTGPTALLALGLGDVLSSLVAIISRRAEYGPQDSFLPALIDSTSSLATRVYYLDQITDLVQDLITALKRLPPPSPEVPATNRTTQGTSMLKCLIGVLRRSQTSLASSSEVTRSRVEPAVWSRSLFLWTDVDPHIRFTYAHTLLQYISSELVQAKGSPSSGESPALDPSSRKDFFDALALAAYRLALAHFSANPSNNSSASSSKSRRSSKSNSPTHGKTNSKAGASLASTGDMPTVDDCSALQKVLLAAIGTGMPEATLSILPMLSALLSSSHVGQHPETNAACRELINNTMRAAINLWSTGSVAAPVLTASHFPPLRSLEEGPSGQALTELGLVNAAPSDMEFPSIEDLAKSSQLQAATGMDASLLLVTLKEPWTVVKASQKNMGVRGARPISSVASISRMKNQSQASFKNPSVSDLRASLTSPLNLFHNNNNTHSGGSGSGTMEAAQDNAILLNRRSLRIGSDRSASPDKSTAVSGALSDPGSASRTSSPTKPSPLRS